LLVGDRAATVTRIAIALDQTVPMVDAAAAAGCNLLVTHHPGFFFPAPDSFLATPSAATSSGAVVYRAAQRGVALLALHTNLDCALSAANMLLEPVGLEYVAPLRPHGTGSLGQIARPVRSAHSAHPAHRAYSAYSAQPADDSARLTSDSNHPARPADDRPASDPNHPADEHPHLELHQLASACLWAFGRVAKVWGDPAKLLFTVAVCSGGAGEVVPDVIAQRVDCLITGELRHHEALYLADEGIALIELGHDTSELPYRLELRKALVAAGFPPSDIEILAPSATWWQPSIPAEDVRL
ncbi:MAG: Nif3-like dinuclear metal center hexameric protein, partial [Coriobacteriales bacterium]|jgi:putative NIF3 family GTP cyclohydrolase 1 type 2|nr:Nif3-like dinuclear metal center hexameric protein [Coriobacteriales bacterium]